MVARHIALHDNGIDQSATRCPYQFSGRVCGLVSWGSFMDGLALSGRSILVVEEEPLVALQLEEQLHRAGAKVLAARKLHEALHMAEHPALSAAVVNVRLGSDNTNRVCRRLSQLGVPFLFHTRYDPAEALRNWPDAPVVSKPADSRVVVNSVAQLLS